MINYRNPEYVESYNDVVFELETPLVTNVANNAHQTKTNYRFVADNSGEVFPFDWYNSRFLVNFKLEKLSDGGDIAAEDHNGVVNGVHSLIKAITIKVNGIPVYDNTSANQTINIKNLLEYDTSYANSTATNAFFYIDTNRSAEERQAQAAYNKGFAARKVILGTSDTVNYEIPLNRYSFFEALEDEFLPNSKVEIQVTIESDANLVWQAADNCRIVIEKFQLWVPKIQFNSTGQELYMSKYLKPHKWTYLREMVERSVSSRQQSGTFRITSGISKPRHVFVWILNDARVDDQTQNPFLYDTFNVANNQKMISCQLEVGNGNQYPEVEYTPSTDVVRVYRDVMNYVHANNDFKGGTLLTRANFESIFSLVYFDLTKQKEDIKDGTTKLSFKYKLAAGTNADYSVYAMVLYNQDVELTQSSGKLMLRS